LIAHIPLIGFEPKLRKRFLQSGHKLIKFEEHAFEGQGHRHFSKLQSSGEGIPVDRSPLKTSCFLSETA